MRGKDYNTGLRGVLFEARHYEKMGAAVWLYGWLILRQTHQSRGLGFVLGGAPISYREIEEETGFKRRTLECWMRVLRRGGYIETVAAPSGVVVRITKAKKFPQRPQKSTGVVRKFSGAVRELAEGPTQKRAASVDEPFSNHQLPDRICSSSVDGSIERKERANSSNNSHTDADVETHTLIPKFEQQKHGHKPNHSCLSTSQNQDPGESQGLSQSQESREPEVSPAYQQYLFVREAHARWAQLRAERDEEVRRELRAGTGPEVQR